MVVVVVGVSCSDHEGLCPLRRALSTTEGLGITELPINSFTF